jgi:hypothetical protein
MDPLSIISLAGNLAQFVEISSQILAEACSVYKTGVGNTTRVEALARQVEALQAFAARASTTNADGTRTPDEIALVELSRKTKNLVREVTKFSNTLQIKSPKSRFNAIVVAAKTHIKEREITRLEQSISDCRADIVERWAMMTRSVLYFIRSIRRL